MTSSMHPLKQNYWCTGKMNLHLTVLLSLVLACLPTQGVSARELYPMGISLARWQCCSSTLFLSLSCWGWYIFAFVDAWNMPQLEVKDTINCLSKGTWQNVLQNMCSSVTLHKPYWEVFSSEKNKQPVINWQMLSPSLIHVYDVCPFPSHQWCCFQ